jgi:4-amino-4-deoxy-L-arabinose transferase-like glycosyltransferase
MTDHDPHENEAPLDPAAERLRRKLLRLLMVSGGFMILGLIAVFAAIVYRLGGGADAGEGATFAAGAPVEAHWSFRQGRGSSPPISTGARALLTLETPGGAVLLLVAMPSGQIIGRYPLRPQ